MKSLAFGVLAMALVVAPATLAAQGLPERIGAVPAQFDQPLDLRLAILELKVDYLLRPRTATAIVRTDAVDLLELARLRETLRPDTFESDSVSNETDTVSSVDQESAEVEALLDDVRALRNEVDRLNAMVDELRQRLQEGLSPPPTIELIPSPE